MTDFSSASMQPAPEFTKVHVEQVTGTDKYKATGTFEWNGRQVTLTRTFTSDPQSRVTDDVAKAKLNEIKQQMLSVAQKEIFTTGGTISLQNRMSGTPDEAPAPARQFALLKTTQDATTPQDISAKYQSELNQISSIFGKAMDQLRQSGAVSPQLRPQDQPPPYELAPSPKRRFPSTPAPQKLATAEKAKEQAVPLSPPHAEGAGSEKPRRTQEDTIVTKKHVRFADDAESLILQEIPQDDRAAVQQQPQALLQQDQPSDAKGPVALQQPAQPLQQQRTEPTAASSASSAKGKFSDKAPPSPATSRAEPSVSAERGDSKPTSTQMPKLSPTPKSAPVSSTSVGEDAITFEVSNQPKPLAEPSPGQAQIMPQPPPLTVPEGSATRSGPRTVEEWLASKEQGAPSRPPSPPPVAPQREQVLLPDAFNDQARKFTFTMESLKTASNPPVSTDQRARSSSNVEDSRVVLFEEAQKTLQEMRKIAEDPQNAGQKEAILDRIKENESQLHAVQLPLSPRQNALRKAILSGKAPTDKESSLAREVLSLEMAQALHLASGPEKFEAYKAATLMLKELPEEVRQQCEPLTTQFKELQSSLGNVVEFEKLLGAQLDQIQKGQLIFDDAPINILKKLRDEANEKRTDANLEIVDTIVSQAERSIIERCGLTKEEEALMKEVQTAEAQYAALDDPTKSKALRQIVSKQMTLAILTSDEEIQKTAEKALCELLDSFGTKVNELFHPPTEKILDTLLPQFVRKHSVIGEKMQQLDATMKAVEDKEQTWTNFQKRKQLALDSMGSIKTSVSNTWLSQFENKFVSVHYNSLTFQLPSEVGKAVVTRLKASDEYKQAMTELTPTREKLETANLQELDSIKEQVLAAQNHLLEQLKLKYPEDAGKITPKDLGLSSTTEINMSIAKRKLHDHQPAIDQIKVLMKDEKIIKVQKLSSSIKNDIQALEGTKNLETARSIKNDYLKALGEITDVDVSGYTKKLENAQTIEDILTALKALSADFPQILNGVIATKSSTFKEQTTKLAELPEDLVFVALRECLTHHDNRQVLRVVFSQLENPQNIEKCQKLLIDAANPPKDTPSNEELVGEFSSFCFEFVKMQATLRALQQVLPADKKTSLDEAVKNCDDLLKAIKGALSEEQANELEGLLTEMQKPENYRNLMGTHVAQPGVTPPNYKNELTKILEKASDSQTLVATVDPKVVAGINETVAAQFQVLSKFSPDTTTPPAGLRELGESLAQGWRKDKSPQEIITSKLSVLMTQFMTRQADTASAVLKNVSDISSRGSLVNAILSATQTTAQMNA